MAASAFSHDQHHLDAFKKIEKLLYSLILRILRRYYPSDAEDVLQEVRMKFLRVIVHRHCEAEWLPVAYRTAINQAYDFLDKYKRERELTVAAPHIEHVKSTERGLEQEAIFADLLEKLQGRLSDENYQIAVAYLRYQMTYEEIAGFVGLPSKEAVKMRWARVIRPEMQKLL